MEKNSQISHAKHFKLIYVDTLPSKRWSINPHFLSMGVDSDSLPRIWYGKGENINFIVKNSDNITSVKWSNLTLTMISHVSCMYLWYELMTMALYMFSPSQNSKPQFNYEKNIRQIPIEKYLIRYLTNFPQSCQRTICKTVRVKSSLRRYDN